LRGFLVNCPKWTVKQNIYKITDDNDDKKKLVCFALAIAQQSHSTLVVQMSLCFLKKMFLTQCFYNWAFFLRMIEILQN
jgi:hypothetical protein